jgi:hypothetical protein
LHQEVVHRLRKFRNSIKPLHLSYHSVLAVLETESTNKYFSSCENHVNKF